MALYVGNTRRKPMIDGVGYKFANRLPYDSKVEYIQKTNGHEVIDTGLYATNNTTIRLEIMNIGTVPNPPTNDYIACGASIWFDNTYRYGLVTNTSGKAYFMYNNTYVQANCSVSLNTKRIVEINKSGSNFLFVIDGSSLATASVGDFTTTTTVTVLGRVQANGNYVGSQLTRLYAFKLWESGVLVRDMIPVRVGQVGYMYDNVSKQLFGNVNTSGSFIVGNDV